MPGPTKSGLIKLKQAQVPLAKRTLMERQGGVCALCLKPFGGMALRDIVLDHCHKSGAIRGALCRNCNGMEGQIQSRATRAKRDRTAISWLRSLLAYWELHSTPQTKYAYPTHKTEEDKRLARNRKAREARAKKKE